MNDFIFIFLSTILISLPIWIGIRKSKKEKAQDKYLEDSLEDETLIDPETGARITLEQAENGHWIKHDNEFFTIPEEEINKLVSEEEKKAYQAINYLKKEIKYRRTEFSEDDFLTLENLKILNKYDNWSYGYVFKLDYVDGLVFLPTVELNGRTYREEDYIETHLMFWTKTQYDLGHYYLREKDVSEKFFDLIRNDDDLILENFESFTIRKSNNLLYINQILISFKGINGLEIEFYEKNIFIKTLRLVTLNDILMIEKIICNIYKV